MTVKCIAFCGRAGSGKTTISEEYVSKRNYVRLSFAAPVKQCYREVYGCEPNKHESSVRRWLQEFGTNFCRGIDSEVWVKNMARRVKAIQSVNDICSGIVIDDVRFRNEADWLRQKGFVIVKVVGRGYELSKDIMAHPSEAEVELVEADIVLDNSGTVEETMKQLEMKLEQFEARLNP